MNSQVCVNCHNKKNVNLTDNRLVTESCGHVKCMDCLLREKSGCSACNEQTEKTLDSGLVAEIEVAVDADNIQTRPEPVEVIDEEDSSERKLLHIKIKLDGNTKRYYCEPCDKLFRSRSQVAYHAYCGGQRKPYQCPQCDKGFSTHSHYKYHMRVHRNERAYPCELCGESFFQMSKLQRHKLKHTKEKKYVCELCHKAFNNFSALRKHGLTHTDERPYKCEACNRRFRDRSNYKKHEAKHKAASCRVCGPRAIKNGNLAVATGAEGTGATGAESPGATGAGQPVGRGCTHVPARRPHQCPRCPQTFHSKKDMRRHAQVHTDTKAFRCKICNRRFRRKDNLERHIRNTHPEHESAGAVECDEGALRGAQGGGATNGTEPDGSPKSANSEENFENTKLKILNPLPPLPEDVIQKHMYADKTESVDQSVNQSVDRSKRETVRTERYKVDLHINSERQEITQLEVMAENRAMNGHANPSVPTYTNDFDRTKIKILNPLPPLPQELIQKHMYAGKCEPVLDKSYILEANNARQSVIVGNCPIDRRISSPIPEYVHKIRKANSISSSKDSLPPIDEEKLLELGTRSSMNKLDVGAPHPKNIETYKNILYDKLEKPRGEVKVTASPEMHWRRKMLNMNW